MGPRKHKPLNRRPRELNPEKDFTKGAKSKHRMQIFGTPQESDNISVFWEKEGKNEPQIFVLKIGLETIAWALHKASNLRHIVLFVSVAR